MCGRTQAISKTISLMSASLAGSEIRNLGKDMGIRWVGNQVKVFKALSFGGFPEADILCQAPNDYRDDFMIIKRNDRAYRA